MFLVGFYPADTRLLVHALPREEEFGGRTAGELLREGNDALRSAVEEHYGIQVDCCITGGDSAAQDFVRGLGSVAVELEEDTPVESGGQTVTLEAGPAAAGQRAVPPGCCTPIPSWRNRCLPPGAGCSSPRWKTPIPPPFWPGCRMDLRPT